MKIVAIILILAYAILYDDVASKAAVKDTLFEKNEINFEFFGHSLGMLSLNYEHTFYNVKNILHLTWRCGIGWLPGYDESNGSRAYAIESVPVVLSSYIGRKNNLFYCAVGYTGSFGRKWVDTNSLPPVKFKGYESAFVFSIGYRLRIKDFVNYGVYPCYIWRDRSSAYERFSVGIYAGIPLNRHRK